MKKLFYFITCSFSILFVLFSISKPVQAADAMNVGVTAIIPDNQVDKNQTYFDLLMKPGQEQELEVKLTNSSDEDRTVEIQVNPATTNDNGTADYSLKETPKNRDSSLKISMADIATTENEVLVPKKSSVNAKIKLKMPNETFKGVVAGGIRVSEKENEKKEEEKKDTGGVQINNKFVFTVGLQLRTEESLEGLEPDLVLDKTKIKPKHVNYRNFVGINLQNNQPVFIRDLEVEAKIYKKGSKEVLHETKKTQMKMSPNSNFNFGVDWENKELEGGDYVASVRAYSKDYDKEWKWDNQEFHIDAETAKKLNAEAVNLEKSNKKLYIMIGIGLILLLLLIIILLIMKNKKEKARRKARKNKKSSKNSSKKSSKSSSKNKSKSKK